MCNGGGGGGGGGGGSSKNSSAKTVTALGAVYSTVTHYTLEKLYT